MRENWPFENANSTVSDWELHVIEMNSTYISILIYGILLRNI